MPRSLFSRLGPAVAGFALAISAALILVRITGFDLGCQGQILCTVSVDPGWATQIHLSWRALPSDSLTVTWRTASRNDPAVVQFRRVTETEWRSATARSAAMPANGLLAHRGALHRATVTGLEPATAYEYRVSNGRDAPVPMSGIFQTRTGPSSENATFSFIFFSDTGLIGRPDGLATGTRAIRDFLLGSDALFLLGGGDYAYANRDGRFVFPGDAVDEWFRQWEPVLSRTPLMAQYGNHEIFLREGFDQWAPRFGHPEGFGNGRAYSFDVGSAHFAAMFAPGDGYLPPAALLDWLDQDLRRARESGAAWLIVYQHDSLFGSGLSHPADPRLRALMMPILEKHGVDLHLSAQDQSYERTYPLGAAGSDLHVESRAARTYAAGQGVIYAKVSPAGKMSEITRDFSHLTQPQTPHIAERSDDGHHFARVTVSGSERLDVEVLKLRAGETAPTVFDHFSVERRPREGRFANAPPTGLARCRMPLSVFGARRLELNNLGRNPLGGVLAPPQTAGLLGPASLTQVAYRRAVWPARRAARPAQ